VKGNWITGVFNRQELKRHLAAKLEVLGGVNDTHPAGTQLFQ
jgi:hypothetical protein